MTSLPTQVRYAIRNIVTSQFVSNWQSKSLHHQWTSEPELIRSYKKFDAALMAIEGMKDVEIVELTIAMSYVTVAPDNKVKAAREQKIEDAKNTIRTLNAVDQFKWTTSEDTKYRAARKLLYKHGLNPELL